MPARNASVTLGDQRSAAPSTTAMCLSAALIAVLALALLEVPPKDLAEGAAVAVAVPTLLWTAALTRRDPSWAISALALMGFLIGFPLLSERARLMLHYGLIALFCIPLMPALWRCGIVWQGGFRLFAIYFTWALVTIAYSLAPSFSVARLVAGVLTFGVASLCAAQIRSRDEVDRLIGRLVAAYALVVVFNLAAALVLPSSITYEAPFLESDVGEATLNAEQEAALPRFNGILDHPNAIGILALFGVSGAMLYWPRVGRRKRVLLGLLAVGALALGVMADSRSPMVAVGVGCVLFVLWRYGLRGLPVLVVAALLGVAMLRLAGHGASEYIGRGDVTTLTGRTDMWQFVIHKIKARPMLGYGYEVAGAIFRDPRFPLWWGPYQQGAHSSLHNGYLSHVVGVGIPATLFWLFIFLRPWGALLMRRDDPWALKPALFLLAIPLLISNLTEASLGDFSDPAGLLFGVMWAIAERYRLLARATNRRQDLISHGLGLQSFVEARAE